MIFILRSIMDESKESIPRDTSNRPSWKTSISMALAREQIRLKQCEKSRTKTQVQTQTHPASMKVRKDLQIGQTYKRQVHMPRNQEIQIAKRPIRTNQSSKLILIYPKHVTQIRWLKAKKRNQIILVRCSTQSKRNPCTLEMSL